MLHLAYIHGRFNSVMCNFRYRLHYAVLFLPGGIRDSALVHSAGRETHRILALQR
jgi:hypothetical protein